MARVVQIRWCYPLPFGNSADHGLSNEIGLYQITRYWGGTPALGYVGIVWSDHRSFRQRMAEHSRDWIDTTRGTFELRFGQIESWEGAALNRSLVEEAEGVLICHHQPPFNTSKRSTFSLRNELIVKNVGYRGFLDPQIDTTVSFDWV